MMDGDMVLVSAVDDDEVNQELVEMPIGVYDNGNVVIDSATYEVSSSSMDLMETHQVIETEETMELIDECEPESQLMEEHLYAVVCTGPNGEMVEEVTVEGDHDEHESVIEITLDHSLNLPVNNVANESLEEPVHQTFDVETVATNGSFLGTAEEMVNEPDEDMVNEADEDMVNEPDEDMVNEPDEDMVNDAAVEISDEPPEEAVNEPVDETVVETVTEVIDEEVDDTVTHVIDIPTVETVTEVIDEEVDETVTEVIDEEVDETVTEVIDEEVDETVTHVIDVPTVETVTEVIDEAVDETVTHVIEEPTVETVTEAVDETVTCVIDEPIVETVTEADDATVTEEIDEPLNENFDVSETVIPVSGTLDSSVIEMGAESVELVNEVSVKEMCTESVGTGVEEVPQKSSSSGEVSDKVDGEVASESESHEKQAESAGNLNSTVVSAGEADSTLDAAALTPSTEEQTAEGGNLIIDTSKPIELKVDAILWINNHKCIIQNHPEKSGELVAYPVQERTRKRKPRGRPRKLRQPSVVEEETEVEEKPKPEVEDKTEKGFVQMADASGAVVKRSARKRKRASHLDEYETGMVGAASDNEDQSVAEDDEDYSKIKNSVGYSFRGRGVRGRGRGRASAQIANGGRGRGRGRPRRYNIEPEKVEVVQKSKPAKPQPQQQQQQAYLVQMADGRTVVIQVPVTGLAEGMTSQSLAMSVAEALSSGQSSGVLNISVQRSTGNAVTTEKIVEIKKEAGADDKKNDQVPAATAAAPPTLIPLTVVPPKAEPAAQIGLKTSDADLAKYRCSKCDFQGYYLQQQQDHLQSAHSDVIIRCRCCPHVTLQKTELIDHFKEKHPKCICSTCNFMVDQPYAMRRHMQRHITTGTTCHICGKTYKDRYILRIHMRMVHMPAKILFECPLCTKKFNRKAHLVRHLRTHNPAKPYKCSKCDYRGSERSDITKHSLIHEEPKHVCEICGHNFRHLRNKEIHLKRHSGQKDYKCGVCDFYGYTFTEIRKHIARKHASDPNTRLCLKCGQAFLNDLQLAEHHMTGQCEAYTREEALLATEDLPLEDENEMEVEVANTSTNGEQQQPSIELSEDALSVVVNSSELMDMKGSEEEEVLTSGSVDVNCEPPTISLVSDGVEFDGSHGLLTLLSEDGQVIRGIILDSGELETQVESTVVLEEVT